VLSQNVKSKICDSFEKYATIQEANKRERQLKRWKNKQRIDTLINKSN